jgi:hypothetical protein
MMSSRRRALLSVLCAGIFFFSCTESSAPPKEAPREPLQLPRIAPPTPDLDLSGKWKTRLNGKARFLQLSDSRFEVTAESMRGKDTIIVRTESGGYTLQGNKLLFEGKRYLTNREGAEIDSFSISYGLSYRLSHDTLYYSSIETKQWEYFLKQ